MNLQLAQITDKLTASELQFLYDYWTRSHEVELQPIDILPEVANVEQQKGICCPHCKSIHIKKHGFYRKRRRYFCTSCSSSFNDLTGTPFAGIHYLTKMVEYVKYMTEFHTLRELSSKLKICLDTSFNWRHKILYALSRKEYDKLDGICETDETFFLYSEKGSRKVQEHRKPRKRGGKAEKRGISNELVPVIVSCDRKEGIVCGVAGCGRISADDIDEILGNYINSGNILCTDAHNSYGLFAKQHKLNHEILNINKGERVKQGIYHIQTVNSFHSQLKKWIRRFNGVATKYLTNYLNWFRALKKLKNKTDIVKHFIDYALWEHQVVTNTDIHLEQVQFYRT